MASLFDLPQYALLCLLGHIAAAADVGQILRLAAASAQCLRLVASADWFFQERCQALGWIRSGVQHPPRMLPPPTSQQADPAGRATPALWFKYFSLRMSCRWRLRRLLAKFIPFLNIHSRLALQRGASISELEAAEARLRMRLPWELWELYRHRAGQAPGPGVLFADTCRLLGLHELHLAAVEPSGTPSLAPEGAPTQQQQLAGVQAQLPLLSILEPAAAGGAGSSGQCSSSCQPWRSSPNSVSSGSGGSSLLQQQQQQDQQLEGAIGAPDTSLLHSSSSSSTAAATAVVFMSNAAGSPMYACCRDSSVHLLRGLTSRRVAGSVSGFIQRLLT